MAEAPAMCLILIAWQTRDDLPLVVAANRDEYFARPTSPACFWPDLPQIFAGRDLEAGGTWLGVTRGGRFAALTNFRDPQRQLPNKRSRGELVANFLSATSSPAEYASAIEREVDRYNGFNLLIADRRQLRYVSNAGGDTSALAPGVYGLSNHLLDTPWPKVARARSELTESLAAIPQTEPLFAMLRDETIAADEHLPRTGVSLEWERLLSAAFVRSPDYGTRCSTVVTIAASGEVDFEERGFGSGAGPSGTVHVRFTQEGANSAS